VLVLCAACGLLAPRTARAQERDIDEALNLARQGQFEKAEDLARRAAGVAGAPPQARAAVDLVRAEVLSARAETETKVEPALKLLDESIDLLKVYLRSNPSVLRAAAARRGIDWRLRRKAARAAQAAREVKADEAGKREVATRLAANLYEAAILRYEERARELKSGKITADEDETLEVILDGARAQLEYGLLNGLADEARKASLTRAIAVLQDFQFDYADDAASFEAMWIEGLCHAEMGDARTAEDRFLGATTLVQRLGDVKEPNPYHQGILRGAYISLSENYLQSRRLDDAKALVDRAFAADPDLASDPSGMRLKLQKAEALFQEGDVAAAHEIASQVIHSDPDGRIAAAAKEKMRVWSSDARAAGAKASPERLLIRATARIENQAWFEALQDLRAAIEAAPAGETRARYQPEAHFKMGQCFFRMERYHEAAFAFERVFNGFPAHELAPRAAFEAVRALGSEFQATGDPRDDQLKEKYLAILLEKWPEVPAARNVPFLQAERLEREAARASGKERASKYAAAAAAFARVAPEAEAHEAALVAAGRCHFQEGSELWTAKDEDGARAAMEKAAAALRRFFDHAANPAHTPKGQEAVRTRAQLAFLATQQLALVHTHESTGKYQEALAVLDAYAQKLAPDDPWLPRILALKVRPYLALGQGDEAVKSADQILDRFPESPYILPALKAAAAHLEKTIEERQAKGEDPASLSGDLKRIHRYYLKWIRESVARGQRVAPAEAASIAQTLYDHAKELNGFGKEVTSFAFAPAAAPLPAQQYFQDAAQVLRLLTDGKLGALDERDRIDSRLALARAEGFLARDAEGWEKAKAAYLGIVKEQKLIEKDGKVQPAALAVHSRSLLATLLELGVVHQEQAKKGQAQLFDEAITAFQNVQAVTEGGSEAWWLAKYFTVRALIERGGPSDVNYARTFLDNVETNYPDYDGDKYGMKTRLKELRSRMGGGR
jgi:tetratricopeptide (TPR) repeat protein